MASVQRLLDRALQNLHPIRFDGRTASGPGWDLVVAESRAAEFVLLGEEHGLAELPPFAAALFSSLRTAGFDSLGIEVSPPIAEELDLAARAGLGGIEAYVKSNPPGPAFYFWRPEAELLAAVRGAVPRNRQAIWGLDYEVTGDRRLIARLRAKAPAPARPALDALDRASAAAWETWRNTHNPGALFTFSGDPALVRAVRTAWTRPDADVDAILTTLEETLEINRLYGRNGWESNERRSRLMRSNLVRRLNAEAAHGRKSKVLFKMGETHMMRGVSTTGSFDVGTLIHEAAALRGGKAFSMIVGGGKGAMHGVLDPTVMATRSAPCDMLGSFMGLQFLLDALPDPGPMLVDFRPLRALLGSEARLKELNNPGAARAIFAFDVAVVWNGATPTRMLSDPGPR